MLATYMYLENGLDQLFVYRVLEFSLNQKIP